MIVLAIDTSTRWAGVGLLDAKGKVHETNWRSEQNHGRELMPAIHAILAEGDSVPTDVTHIGVAIGPGGFSAVRVGMSAALGLALPRDLPLAGVGTHALEAAPHIDGSTTAAPLYSLLPAGRGELAWARFEGSLEPAATGVSSADEFAATAPKSAQLCGESAEELVSYFPPESFFGSVPPTRSPGTLIRLAVKAIEAGQAVTGAVLKPIYARPPSISRPKPPA